MKTHADKTQENKSQAITKGANKKQSGSDLTFQFVDNRPETVAQRKLHEMANNGPKDMQLKAFRHMDGMRTNNHPNQVIQRFQVYRSGGKTLGNMTPKAKDLTGDKRGLSTFEDPAAAPIKITKAQVIETTSLPATLEAIRNGKGAKDSHVSIRPPADNDNALLKAWADNSDSPLSKATYDAITSTWNAPKPEKKK
jgi:hypothetical protein